MKQLDEKIVEARLLQRQLEHMDITEGVYIGEKLMKFEERDFFENKMRMFVPKEFFEMPLEFAKIKYPSEQRPKLILTSASLSVNLCLSMFDQPIQKNQVQQAITGYQLLIRRVNPANLFFEEKVETSASVAIGWFDYKSYALDNQLYNLMFVAPIGGKLMLGSFNCSYNEFDDWKCSVLQMLHSITDLTLERRPFQKFNSKIQPIA